MSNLVKYYDCSIPKDCDLFTKILNDLRKKIITIEYANAIKTPVNQKWQNFAIQSAILAYKSECYNKNVIL